MAGYDTTRLSGATAGGRDATGEPGPRLAVVLGTRPEIVKLAPVLEACRARSIPVTLIHTGQHYSAGLDRVFFDRLDLPAPDYHLGVGSGSQGEQTASMLERVESVLLEVRPDVVVVQGDTNSTLAGALAASKLHVPVAHVEAGLRSFDRSMPEEVNRVLTDHVADYCFAPTTHAATMLEREGVDPERISVVGNTVVDALFEFEDVAATESTVLSDLDLTEGDFALLTVHRAENVDDPHRFADLFAGVDRFASAADLEVVLPIHPRSADRIDRFDLTVPDRIHIVEPLDYLDFLRLESAAAIVFTDSGGVQEEACVLGTPCVTLRYTTERPETVFVGANVLAGTDPADVLDAGWRMLGKRPTWENPLGDGRAAERIVGRLSTDLERQVAGATAQ